MKPLWPLLLLLSSQLSFAAQAALPRIVALSPHSVEMLYAIGAGEQIVASVEYADYPQQAQAIPRIGRYNYLDLEQLLLLQPELVIANAANMPAPLKQQLAQLGFEVVDSSVESIDQIPARLEYLGRLTGHPEQAEASAMQFRRELAALREQYRARPSVAVFYQVWPEPLTTASGGWIGEVLQDCGAKNLFASAKAEYPQVSIEQVLLGAPEVILQPIGHSREAIKTLDWQQWPEIPAVAKQLILPLDADLVYRPGPRLLRGMRQICEAVDRARQAL